MPELELTSGQYILYLDILGLVEKPYGIYLAIKDTVFDSFSQRKSITAIIKYHQIEFMV